MTHGEDSGPEGYRVDAVDLFHELVPRHTLHRAEHPFVQLSAACIDARAANVFADLFDEGAAAGLPRLRGAHRLRDDDGAENAYDDSHDVDSRRLRACGQ